jgi:ABC-type nitrate/sulfonate/bicarbonate transport system substrate-binding protein
VAHFNLLLALSVFLASVAFHSFAAAQMKVRVNWSAIAAGQSGIWIANDEGLFKKNGLDVELLHIPSSSRIIQTMLAGEIAISYVDGRNTIQSNLTGSDMALIAGVTNRFSFSLMARPEIKRVSDLKGNALASLESDRRPTPWRSTRSTRPDSSRAITKFFRWRRCRTFWSL